MLIIGLLLLAATGAFTGLVIADNLSGPQHTVSVLGNDIATMSTLAIFCSGLALALIFCLGASLMSAGATHHRRVHRVARYGRHDARPAGRGDRP